MILNVDLNDLRYNQRKKLTKKQIKWQKKQQTNRKMLTEKYLEDKFFPAKLKNDNVIKSTGHYLKKYYIPNSNCKVNHYFSWMNINIK